MWKVTHFGGQVSFVRGNQSPASAARDAFLLTGISVKSVEPEESEPWAEEMVDSFLNAEEFTIDPDF